MDRYLAPSTAGHHEAAGANMADSPTRSLSSEQAEPSLADISADIRALAAAMVTKEDMRALSDTLHAAIRTEVTSLRAELTAQATRMQVAESNVQAMGDRLEATNTAIHRQGNILLQLRRQTEDLDNRGRRSNIRVRGLPEPEGNEDVEATLQMLFRDILGAEAPESMVFDRAHRAARARATDNTPRDIICCLHAYKLKEKIMNKARSRPTWRFRDAEVALYQDLSPLTLEARRALRPVTTLLRDRGIPYKWGFPFMLLARHHDEWFPLRWPEEVPRFLQRLNLPPTEVTDWILGGALTHLRSAHIC
ncbi:Hypothetical predicted protein [Pelobates cultripes]|uniref:L1 transposable element RRM domain-containing protein n=1 Tax=Pelobates cultripes TaxID=61616 RepID=A0AAD1W6C1_PELCU|nr:Hypothetical predicted protein [Pelobates cultripes]